MATGQSKFDISDTTPPQRSSQVLSTQLQTLSAEVDARRAELVELLVLMAERSLNAAGTDVSRADRYQVSMHMDTSDLQSDSNF